MLYSNRELNSRVLYSNRELNLQKGGVKMNRSELRADIARAGISHKSIAKELGISDQGFYNKLNGTSEFKESEIKKIVKMLNLSPSRVNQIFLS